MNQQTQHQLQFGSVRPNLHQAVEYRFRHFYSFKVAMLGRLILLFIFVPLVDLILLMVMSSYTGWPFSVGMVILSGIVGAYLARRSSLSVGIKIRDNLQQGRMAPGLLSDGAMILFAAGLLLTPGFLTDIVGFSLLIPPCRRWYKARLTNWAKRHFKFEVIQPATSQQPDIVDGEVVDRREDQPEVTPVPPELLN